MAGYTKLFASIVHSTIWREPAHVRIVWVTMLAIADRDGLVEASVPGLADIARVSEIEAEQALHQLSGPDIKSRSKVLDGRRVVEVEGGWRLVNYEYYRDKMSAEDQREKAASRSKRWRERRKQRSVTLGDVGDAGSREVRQSEASPSPSPSQIQGEESSPAAPTTELLSAGDRPEMRRFEQSFAATLGPDWKPDKAGLRFAEQAGLDPQREADQFADHHRSRKTRSHDWPAEWRKWCRNGAQRPAVGGAGSDGLNAHERRYLAEQANLKETRRLERIELAKIRAEREASGG